METCPTVKVVANNDQGFIIINEADITTVHKLFDQNTSVVKQTKVAKVSPIEPSPPIAAETKLPWQQ